jgi:membrane protease YdiL (CAAX protease family)
VVGPRTTTPHLIDSGRTEAQTSWLGRHAIAGSVVIAALTGVALQLTHIIDFQEHVAMLVGWNLSVRFVDFGFRMVLGAVVVLGLLPWLFEYARFRPWFDGYLRRLRLTWGPTPGFRLWVSAASVVIMAAIIGSLAAHFDVLRGDLDFALEDSRWFIVILALVPGLWEELAFRGLMLSNLQRRYHPWIAIVLTALFFGLFHISNLLLRDLGQATTEMIMAARSPSGGDKPWYGRRRHLREPDHRLSGPDRHRRVAARSTTPHRVRQHTRGTENGGEVCGRLVCRTKSQPTTRSHRQERSDSLPPPRSGRSRTSRGQRPPTGLSFARTDRRLSPPWPATADDRPSEQPSLASPPTPSWSTTVHDGDHSERAP